MSSITSLKPPNMHLRMDLIGLSFMFSSPSSVFEAFAIPVYEPVWLNGEYCTITEFQMQAFGARYYCWDSVRHK